MPYFPLGIYSYFLLSLPIKIQVYKNMELSGRIIAVLPLQSGQGKNGVWKKQDYVLEYNTNSQYPKRICFNLWGDKIDQFNIKESQELTVSFDVDCREYQGRWYNDIRAWRVVETAGAAGQSMPVSENVPPPFSPLDIPAETDETNDLPF
jgi:hypothetical protein